MSMEHDDDEDVGDSPGRTGRGATEFDCPSCNAHNPVDDPLTEGAEVLCNYCGSQFQVRISSEGRLKLREL
ncbi:MAG: transcription elongation factor 1 family protein [Myxococcaceae bacterium]|nr:transcription elongation factor 1 family protein [Myxococcaceae bacterium]MCI0672537.1 transcription elongation factor 1 family protein [Myxococcaceae bacterium]